MDLVEALNFGHESDTKPVDPASTADFADLCAGLGVVLDASAVLAGIARGLHVVRITPASDVFFGGPVALAQGSSRAHTDFYRRRGYWHSGTFFGTISAGTRN